MTKGMFGEEGGTPAPSATFLGSSEPFAVLTQQDGADALSLTTWADVVASGSPTYDITVYGPEDSTDETANIVSDEDTASPTWSAFSDSSTQIGGVWTIVGEITAGGVTTTYVRMVQVGAVLPGVTGYAVLGFDTEAHTGGALDFKAGGTGTYTLNGAALGGADVDWTVGNAPGSATSSGFSAGGGFSVQSSGASTSFYGALTDLYAGYTPATPVVVDFVDADGATDNADQVAVYLAAADFADRVGLRRYNDGTEALQGYERIGGVDDTPDLITPSTAATAGRIVLLDPFKAKLYADTASDYQSSPTLVSEPARREKVGGTTSQDWTPALVVMFLQPDDGNTLTISKLRLWFVGI